ncbi:hypothetical protein M409DRAFT_21550 [Zasmidium cellare ATCC 36951]|uniref:SMP-30/Gluconolactonase/LRE-like region domain-containing protein n=1 Tax=Zasmidium cellare ATCC 36951 TaxID=1080233 RepID=A0A6A6CLP2_ZASCE|nr:uncharacterized protein M409DRAFT_21550 [Zasmidium cellare ATCC 36951]KAF2168104.1 hypothetical protein M409DRAFT_21550 [Zasmidium cellare ATCC 36951]
MASYTLEKVMIPRSSFFLWWYLCSLSFPQDAYCNPPPSSLTASNTGSPIRTIYQWPNNTAVENLAIRSNGMILATILNSPEVWQVDPVRETATLLYRFPAAASALGIAEVEHDAFAVAVGNFTLSDLSEGLGSWAIWTVDFNGRRGNDHVSWSAWGRWRNKRNDRGRRPSSQPHIQRVAPIPSVFSINGVTSITNSSLILLAVTDASNARVGSFDIATGTYSTAISSASFPNQGGADINGLATSYENNQLTLYATFNGGEPVFGRIPIHKNGTAAAAFEVLLDKPAWPTNADAPQGADGITLGRSGTVWLATNSGNQVVRASTVDSPSDAVVLAGGPNDTLIAGPTALQFGRTRWDEDVLYLSLTGGFAYPGATGVVGGRVVALDTSRLEQPFEDQWIDGT